MRVNIWCDGSCYPPHTPGGWGCVLESGEHRKELSGFIPGACTNIQAEVIAAINALEALRGGPHDVTLVSDSQYVVGHIRGDYKIKANAELVMRLKGLCLKHNVTANWVRGHTGEPNNERCDQLAGEARAKGLAAINDESEDALQVQKESNP